MALKTILVALTTVRDGKRVRFAAKSVVDLTAAEKETLDKLQVATGKLHYRDPVNEGGTVVESKPVVQGNETPSYDGEQIAVGDKSVPQLKAFLDHHKVEYKSSASKADLVKLAEGVKVEDAATGGSTRDGEGDNGDPDAGL